jgi:hypothetical protein
VTDPMRAELRVETIFEMTALLYECFRAGTPHTSMSLGWMLLKMPAADMAPDNPAGV